MDKVELDTLAELPGCPFCGASPVEGDAYLARILGNTGELDVFCPKGHTMQMSRTAWNTRDNLPAIREQADEVERLRHWRRHEIQMIGAAISTRSWHDLETTYNQLRDKMDAAIIRAALNPKQENSSG